MSLVTVDFVSIWSGREHSIQALLDPVTGKIREQEGGSALPDDSERAVLEEEFVRLEGQEYDVEFNDELCAYVVQTDALGEIQTLIAG